MTEAQDITFWEPRKRPNRKKAWEVRWTIDGKQFSRSRVSSELARDFLKDLRAAAKKGERFSPVNGEPESWASASETVLSVVRSYLRTVAASRPAANTWRTVRDACVLVAMACIDDKAAARLPAPAPDARVRSALHAGFGYRFDSSASRPDRAVLDPVGLDADDRECLAWLERVCKPIGAMDAPGAGAVLERLGVRVGGGAPLAADTVRRRRTVFTAMLDHAVNRRLLASNPLLGLKVARTRAADAVDPRVVPDYAQTGRLLKAVRHSRKGGDRFLWAFFSLCYLAGLRPGEARAARSQDITWPGDVRAADAVPGFGVLTIAESRTESGDTATLKHRRKGEVRLVPLPPEAVAVLREHLADWGTAPDGRLWWGRTAAEGEYGTLTGKSYRAAWARARKAALTPAELEAGLAQRPYDLRHGCASLLLYIGLAPPEVARRLGHTVEVLMRTYTHWFTGQINAANAKLGAALDELGPLTGHGPDDGDDSPHDPR
ncbi:tyrosine-type recombinase/integrase [Nocardiopsis sp. CNT-189]|uniref:tyrosine-type recombinase/integrase n=1 Tax=Nocardiopsis oceanisediminis TaxID=2816862 RepID=UPI003B329C12